MNAIQHLAGVVKDKGHRFERRKVEGQDTMVQTMRHCYISQMDDKMICCYAEKIVNVYSYWTSFWTNI